MTDWAGYTNTASTTFRVDHPVSFSPLRITDAAGRAVTPTTWVLSGSRLRARTTISVSPAYTGGIRSWSLWVEEGNGTPALAGINDWDDRTRYPCLTVPASATTCSGPVTIDRTWHVGDWASTSRGRVAGYTIPGPEVGTHASYRIYPRSTSVMRTTARAVPVGSAVTVSGRLTRVEVGTLPADQPGIAGEAMVLQQRPAGSTAWTTVGSATTSSTGAVGVTVRPARTTEYRWRHADRVGVAGPSTSPVVKIGARPAVSLAVLTSTPTARAATSVRMTSSRPQAGYTLRLQRWTGTEWKTLTTAPQSTAGTATVKVLLPAGTVRLRAVAATTPSFAQGVSPTVAVSVRR
ncbi:MAG: hypothetical protein H5T83_03055 [Actinotalea sp.]|nr:hypothetical protein [Actinotalea sp.]